MSSPTNRPDRLADHLDEPGRPTDLDLLRMMVRIRVFEERVLADYTAGKMPGFTHSYIGQEAVAVGACGALRRTDWITSTHRGHGHAIAKGVALRPMMAELYGKAAGVCRGRGGSMHIADFSMGMLGANGIVGGGFGLAVGAAMSSRHLGTDAVALSFFGDGGINKGTFHESMNFAALERLPVIFLCENNRFAQYTAIDRTTAGSALEDRAFGYGIPGVAVDGNDVRAVLEATTAAVERARAGDGPTLIIADTYRFQGHSVGDPEAYRTKDEVAEQKAFDPIPRFEERLLAEGRATKDQIGSIWSDARTETDDATEFAVGSPLPDPATAADDLYADTTADWSAR
jgi:acetoin:2,6-dichlorophenolindophenol oxidoreductase subunit alpha